MSEPQARSYPAGVPCWFDLESPDPAAATAFYGRLFGWQFRPAGPYLIATLHGIDVAGIGSGDGLAAWNTYIRVDDVVASAGAGRRVGRRDGQRRAGRRGASWPLGALH